MPAMRPSSLSVAGEKSQPPVVFGKPGTSCPVAPSYACKRPRPVPASTWFVGDPGTTFAIVELDRNWEAWRIGGKPARASPVAESQAPIRWLYGTFWPTSSRFAACDVEISHFTTVGAPAGSSFPTAADSNRLRPGDLSTALPLLESSWRIVLSSVPFGAYVESEPVVADARTRC